MEFRMSVELRRGERRLLVIFSSDIATSAPSIGRAHVALPTARPIPQGNSGCGGNGGLPLPSLVPVLTGAGAQFAATAIDARGRLADRSMVRALAWCPGTPLTFHVVDRAVVEISPGIGATAVTARGHVRLPATIRHQCRLRTGDRLLMLIRPGDNRLLVFTAPLVEAALLGPAGSPSPGTGHG
jgi:hypothetical protein